jgi:hypothetical protein
MDVFTEVDSVSKTYKFLFLRDFTNFFNILPFCLKLVTVSCVLALNEHLTLFNVFSEMKEESGTEALSNGTNWLCNSRTWRLILGRQRERSSNGELISLGGRPSNIVLHGRVGTNGYGWFCCNCRATCLGPFRW